tara:strand:- start:85 stop:528 length:444 start_codon:yes stop_codon:yes gene_type:complete
MHITHEIKENISANTATDTVTLDYEGRFLRRKKLTSDKGESFLVELRKTHSLNSNDGFILDDGRIIGINPASEPLTLIKHTNLTRIAWHIGNRHIPCQIDAAHLLIRKDHVLEDMLKKLGAVLTNVHAPFIPEGGAYGHARTHTHSK